MDNTNENQLLPIKITKKNITKVIIDTFVSNIDMENEYNLNELKTKLTESYKLIKTKKKSVGVKKNPSKYNIFVKEEMSKIKLEYPNYSNKEILGLAAKKWQEQKKN
tara:strand:+ start:369 stop:689 length:321 start_codon:yes stop_codon:yes gene_type:complete